MDCTLTRTTNAFVVFTRRAGPVGATVPPAACSSSVFVAEIIRTPIGAKASFEELWDVAAVLEALHLGALWRFGDHLKRDQPME